MECNKAKDGCPSEVRDKYFRHTQRRFESRHGIALTRAMYDGLVRDIQEGRAVFVVQATRARSFWLVRMGKSRFLVLYSQGAIVTVYPSHKYKPKPAGTVTERASVGKPIRRRKDPAVVAQAQIAEFMEGMGL